MAKLVSSPKQVIENILDYPAHVSRSPGLISNLAFNRAWYGVRKGESWVFGNSKMIGYVAMTPEDYDPETLDGRQTEGILKKWFVEVGPDNPLHDELWEGLTDFLAEHGKSPSKLARINVLKSESENTKAAGSNVLSDLIVEVAKTLDEEAIRSIRQRLQALL